jgi:hypothetical protein
MTKRYQDAYYIQQGACNPSGILHAMLEACTEIRADPAHKGTQDLCDDPALRMMAHQLAHLFNLAEYDQDLSAYGRDLAICEANCPVS